MAEPVYQMFPFLEYLPLPRNRNLEKSVEHMKTILESAVNERESERERDRISGQNVSHRPPRDLLDLLIPLSKGSLSKLLFVECLFESLCIFIHADEVGLPKEELLPNMWLFFIAGHDTTGQYPRLVRICLSH
jgi:cytochrome P450